MTEVEKSQRKAEMSLLLVNGRLCAIYIRGSEWRKTWSGPVQVMQLVRTGGAIAFGRRKPAGSRERSGPVKTLVEAGVSI